MAGWGIMRQSEILDEDADSNRGTPPYSRKNEVTKGRVSACLGGELRMFPRCGRRYPFVDGRQGVYALVRSVRIVVSLWIVGDAPHLGGFRGVLVTQLATDAFWTGA